MVALIGALMSVALAAGILFLGVIASTLVGGCVGWTVDLAFPFVFSTINHLTGLTMTPFEIGATLGFCGSFVRTRVSTETKKEKKEKTSS